MRATFYSSSQKILSRLADVKVSDKVDIDDFSSRAGNEIDAALTGVYVVPLTGMTAEATDEIGEINADLAAGYLLLSLAASTQSESVYAYASKLIGDAQKKLALYRTGQMTIAGATTDVGTSTSRYRARVSSKGADRKLGTFFGDIYKDFDVENGSDYQYPRRDKPW